MTSPVDYKTYKCKPRAIFCAFSLLLSLVFSRQVQADPSKNTCVSLFATKSVAILTTKKRSDVLEDAGINLLFHRTNLARALSILSSGTFKNHQLLVDAKHSSTAPPLIYFSWTGNSIKDYEVTPPGKYESENLFDNVQILLPASYINSRNFDHYSNSWKYGVGREFTNENFSEGMRAKGSVNEMGEVLFRNQLKFNIEDARLITAPSTRDEIIRILYEMNPSVNWHKVVLKRVHRYDDLTKITFEELEKMQNRRALYDLYIQNPAKALEFSREYVLMSYNKSDQNKSLTFISLAEWIYVSGDFNGYLNLVLKAQYSDTPKGEQIFENFVKLAQSMAERHSTNSTSQDTIYTEVARIRFVNNLKKWLSSMDERTRKRMVRSYFRAYEQ